MTFLIVLICSIAESLALNYEPLRTNAVVEKWHDFVAQRLGLRRITGSAAVLISCAIPSVVAAVLYNAISAESSVLALLLGVAMLLWCLGPRSLQLDVEQYRRHDLEGVDLALDPIEQNFLHRRSSASAEHPIQVTQMLAVEANARLFTTAFWFVLIGPAGCVLWRFCRDLARHVTPLTAEAVLISRLYQILVWLPARVLAFALGLAGILGPVLTVLKRRQLSLAESEMVLGDCAFAALYGDAAEPQSIAGDATLTAAYELVKRSMIVLLVILALLSAAGIV